MFDKKIDQVWKYGRSFVEATISKKAIFSIRGYFASSS